MKDEHAVRWLSSKEVIFSTRKEAEMFLTTTNKRVEIYGY